MAVPKTLLRSWASRTICIYLIKNIDYINTFYTHKIIILAQIIIRLPVPNVTLPNYI